MSYPTPPVGGPVYLWWYTFGALAWERVVVAGQFSLNGIDEFFWEDESNFWRFDISYPLTQPDVAPPNGPSWFGPGVPFQVARWRLDTNQWIGNSGSQSGSPIWETSGQLTAASGPTGGFRIRFAREATFPSGSTTPDSVTYGAWNYIWPADIEEIPLPPGGVRFTANPSVGITGSILDIIDGGTP